MEQLGEETNRVFADMRVLAVIPAFNEEVAIAEVVFLLRKQGIDVLVVDDCSEDETKEVALEAGARLIRLPFRLGYSGALQTGYFFARDKRYDIVLQLDGDGQHNPLEARILLEPIFSGEVDLVLGSRFLGGQSYQVPWPRRLGQRFFGSLAGFLSGIPISDPTTGFQAFGPKVIKFYCTEIFPDDFPDANMWILLNRVGFKVKEVPVVMKANLRSSMHSGFFRPLYYFFKMVLAMFIATFRNVPKKEEL